LSWFKEYRKNLGYKMETIYAISGISCQGYYQQKQRLDVKIFLHKRIVEMVKQVRKEHPRMGSRPMCHLLKVQCIGINKFEDIVSSSGLGIEKKRLWIKTTHSNHNLQIYDNLTYGLELNGINQLWVSDITYYIKINQVYYLIFIQDVYSRRIIGYSSSDNMYTQNNIKALKMAFKLRKSAKYTELIHHSDKGSQYCSNEYTKQLKKAGIQISMAKNSLENPYAERLNGIIKNDYLAFREVNNIKQLNKALKEVVFIYNHKRPHSELDYLTPVEYEKKMQKLPKDQVNTMKLYDFNNDKKKWVL